MTKLEETFTQVLLEQLAAAEAATGVAETRLADQARTLGGAQAVRQLLDRGRTTRQWTPLQRAGRLDLSVEALAVRGRFAPLFTDRQADECLQRLLEGGFYGL